jgi:hypothetical protein
MKNLKDKLQNIVFALNELKGQIQAIDNEIIEFDQSLKKIEYDQMEKERKWKIHEIVAEMKTYIPGDRNKTLAIVANYCNERDAILTRTDTKISVKYYPVWNYIEKQVNVVHLDMKFNTPYFNSGRTLQRLIKENDTFFTNLLKPVDIESPHKPTTNECT